MAESKHGERPIFGPYDAQTPPPLVFHEWAELSAKLARRTAEQRRAILDGARIEPGLYEACNAFWLGALADQIAQDNMRLARVYADICVREMSARGSEEPKRADVDAAQDGAIAVTDVDETALLVALPDRTALPFVPPDPGKPYQPPLEPKVSPDSPAPKSTEETQLVTALKIDPDGLPFRRREDGERALARVPEASATPESERPDSTEQTVLVPALKPKGDALPFRKPDDSGKPR